MDLSDRWKDQATYTSNNPGDSSITNNLVPAIYMKTANCPSYSPPSANDSWLSYRVNVGRMMHNSFDGDAVANITTPYIPAEGVFTDQFSDVATTPAAKQEQIVHVNLGFINSKDGTACTLMLSENAASVPPTVYAFEGKWSPLIGNVPKTEPLVDGDTIATTLTQMTASTYYQTTTVTNALRLGFNWAGMNPNDPDGIVTKNTLATPATKMYSNHPGGVVASFCDGHQTFLRTDLEPVVYMQLMCPFDRGVYASGTNPSAVIGIADPNTPSLPVPPLDEDKY
jgi:prepilin-type processing-associated H-X9-DG protein